MNEYSTSELWDNPLFSLEHRLEIAKGAINFRDRVIDNLRDQVRYWHQQEVTRLQGVAAFEYECG
jgi:serine/threonine-protein kinase RIO1